MCPKCSSEMGEKSCGGIRLDLCGICFGVWFDGGELEAFQSGEGSARLSDVPGPDTHFEPTGDSAHVKCPRCERDILRTGKISRHEVMRCTCCRGLFLPNADSHLKTSSKGILDSVVGVLDEIVGALF